MLADPGPPATGSKPPDGPGANGAPRPSGLTPDSMAVRCTAGAPESADTGGCVAVGGQGAVAAAGSVGGAEPESVGPGSADWVDGVPTSGAAAVAENAVGRSAAGSVRACGSGAGGAVHLETDGTSVSRDSTGRGVAVCWSGAVISETLGCAGDATVNR